MSLRQAMLIVTASAVFASTATATVRYVNVNSASPASPYTSWATAATNIQSASDIAVPGDLVLVTNGVYQTGTAKFFGLTRVVIHERITVQSVNGPEVTIIKGYQVPGTTNGAGSVSCVYLPGGSTISGFTLTNGSTTGHGGGIYCKGTGTGAIVTNCIITGNSASGSGGGGYSGNYINCIISGNTSFADGGGIYGGAVVNCAIIGNSAQNGGGIYGAGPINCTISGNAASGQGGGVNGGSTFTMNNCIVYYNTAPSGSNYANIKMNYCCTVPTLDPNSISNAPLFVDPAAGNFRLQPGSACINAGNNAYVANGTDLGGNSRIIGGTVDMGAYEFQPPVRYVNLNNSAPVAPFTNWITAATNIQDAIDVAVAGDFIVVSNGVYKTGGQVASSAPPFGFGGGGSNRVVVAKAVTVQSMNGPALTIIQGYQVPGTKIGTNAIRCAWLTNGAVLSGFTLTNGATGSNVKINGTGGGAFSGGVITNCVLVGNFASHGGGVFGGTLNNCKLVANSVSGGYGGAQESTLNNCIIVSNSAPGGNVGGVGLCYALNNCTIAYNSGGGVYGGLLTNCIVYYNTGGNYMFIVYISSYLNHCCTTPLITNQVGSITNEPVFVDPGSGDFRLQTNSPCINAGSNVSAPGGPDLDGNPRIVGGTVDMGAFEFQSPASAISYAWLQQYGLPVDGTADYGDSDGDGMNNWQEWHTGTIPNDPASLLKMLTPINGVSGTTITWQSVSGMNYFVQRSTNLVAQPSFSTVQSDIVGQPGTTSYTDATAVGEGSFYYRVGVQ